ncbi:MAG: CvpA family protein [Flavobacteriales bacterium]|nr:CvpA family protein [Flavobacteriales bacterium]
MNYFDIIILIPLLWGAYKGFKKGVIIEAASFVALGLGVWGGIKFSAISAKYLSEAFDISEKIMPLISFAVTFILIVIGVFMLAKMLQKIVSMVALGFVNKIAGALFGMLKFGLILSVVINFTNLLNAQVSFIEPEMKKSSILYEPIGKIAQIIIPGIKNISLNNIIENAVMEVTSEKIEEVKESLE